MVAHSRPRRLVCNQTVARHTTSQEDRPLMQQYTRLASETAEYRARREELQQAEIQLMQQRERVAAMRRSLPQGAVVQDYVFHEGPPSLAAGDSPVQSVRLS